MSLVIDSSTTLAWLFEDERTQAADALLQRVVEHGAVVPSLWKLEVANALQSALRRGRIDAQFRDASLASLAGLDITVDTETDRHAWTTTLQLAQQHRLTTYDASYLELARRLELPLATYDEALTRACAHEHIERLG